MNNYLSQDQLNRLNAIKENVRQTKTLVSGLRERIQALKAMRLWAEIDNGETIQKGAQVRHLFHTYECTQEHTKSILRAPTNNDYWTRLDDE